MTLEMFFFIFKCMRIRQLWLYLPPREMAKIYLSEKIFFLSKFKDIHYELHFMLLNSEFVWLLSFTWVIILQLKNYHDFLTFS